MIEILTLFIVIISFNAAFSYNDNFEEKLLIKPLPSGHIYSQFKFMVEQDVTSSLQNELKHFHLFPRSIGEMVSKHAVQELHFSLTQGMWRYEIWGYSHRNAPPGVELWAWFKPGTIDVTSNWYDLVNLMSGQFCASLNFIDETNTIIPQWSFYPEGAIVSDETYNSSYARYATLPHEIVCTENLTPFKKLLPCGTEGGLSTLSNSVNLFGAHYLSLAIDFKTICKDPDCNSLSLQIVQSLSVVTDSSIQDTGKQDWSFMRLFGSGLFSSCPLSSVALVIVDISNNKTGVPFALSMTPTKILSTQNEQNQSSEYAVYNLKRIFQYQSRPLNLAATYKSTHAYWLISPPALYANRYVAGYGHEHGGIHCTIYNYQAEPLKIVYLDVIPWFMRTYFHTLEIKDTKTGKDIEPERIYYQPAKDRGKPHHLEMVLTLPPRSEVKITLEFDYAFLKWTEYAPDANHGFYAGPAVISAVLKEDKNFTAFLFEKNLARVKTNFVRVHTQILLVTLPTPDFSMPYNVICLACTVVALAFGPVHNLTTKTLNFIIEEEESQRESFFSKIKRKAKELKRKFLSGKASSESEESSKKDQ